MQSVQGVINQTQNLISGQSSVTPLVRPSLDERDSGRRVCNPRRRHRRHSLAESSALQTFYSKFNEDDAVFSLQGAPAQTDKSRGAAWSLSDSSADACSTLRHQTQVHSTQGVLPQIGRDGGPHKPQQKQRLSTLVPASAPSCATDASTTPFPALQQIRFQPKPISSALTSSEPLVIVRGRRLTMGSVSYDGELHDGAEQRSASKSDEARGAEGVVAGVRAQARSALQSNHFPYGTHHKHDASHVYGQARPEADSPQDRSFLQQLRAPLNQCTDGPNKTAAQNPDATDSGTANPSQPPATVSPQTVGRIVPQPPPLRGGPQAPPSCAEQPSWRRGRRCSVGDAPLFLGSSTNARRKPRGSVTGVEWTGIAADVLKQLGEVSSGGPSDNGPVASLHPQLRTEEIPSAVVSETLNKQFTHQSAYQQQQQRTQPSTAASTRTATAGFPQRPNGRRTRKPRGSVTGVEWTGITADVLKQLDLEEVGMRHVVQQQDSESCQPGVPPQTSAVTADAGPRGGAAGATNTPKTGTISLAHVLAGQDVSLDFGERGASGDGPGPKLANARRKPRGSVTGVEWTDITTDVLKQLDLEEEVISDVVEKQDSMSSQPGSLHATAAPVTRPQGDTGAVGQAVVSGKPVERTVGREGAEGGGPEPRGVRKQRGSVTGIEWTGVTADVLSRLDLEEGRGGDESGDSTDSESDDGLDAVQTRVLPSRSRATTSARLWSSDQRPKAVVTVPTAAASAAARRLDAESLSSLASDGGEWGRSIGKTGSMIDDDELRDDRSDATAYSREVHPFRSESPGIADPEDDCEPDPADPYIAALLAVRTAAY